MLARAAELCTTDWPLWGEFAETNIQDDGRVIDRGAGGISTSEGQSYALFFSLVAGNRQYFDRILKWTNNNLAQGELGKNLPAWKWGHRDDGSWGVLDKNSASDADLWITYSLFQAADIWQERAYLDTATALLSNISEHEIAVLPELGSMLLPAPYGFALDANTWRLNPSYLPIQLLRYFSEVNPSGPWGELAHNTYQMLSATSRRGVIPDWLLYRTKTGFEVDSEQGKFSSYEAIRVYLWWAMLNPQEPLFKAIRPYMGATQFAPTHVLPERINTANNEASGQAPVGFTAALAPYRFILYGTKTATPNSLSASSGYYNQVLSLFGYGWMEQRFRFNADGSLSIGEKNCQD